tara:strand:+ start:448 stop:1224 length:777 start_codon:yes stop_codon:yes gene_type:complete
MRNYVSRLIIKILSLSIINTPVVYLWHLYHTAQLNKAKNNTLHNTFKAIKNNRLDIKSDFPRRDVKALENVIQMILKDNVSIAEIGSWKGMSTSVLAKTVKPFNGKVFAIDHWQGSDGVLEHRQAETNDMLLTFRYNMKTLGIFDTIYPMVMDSSVASLIFADNSLDMIFIDADHRYSQVRADIEMWIPKLKQNGIIAGHDAEEKYTKFGEYIEIIDRHLEEDVIIGVCHPGVVKALYDVFQDNYNIASNSSIWWRRK